MNEKLNKLRKKIDSIDKSLIKLLKNRSKIIKTVKGLKASEDSFYTKIKFARETLMAYSLQKHHFGFYNTNYMQKIWRELISASSAIEENIKIEVLNKDNQVSPLWVLTRDHFGTYSNIVVNNSVEKILNNIESNKTNIGVIPFPDSKVNWWDQLIKHPNIKVSLTLPFLPLPNNTKNETGVILSKAELEESVEDSSLFLIKTTKLNPLSNIKIIFSTDNSFLVIINGFTKNKELVSRFTNVTVDKIFYLGSYPKPIFN